MSWLWHHVNLYTKGKERQVTDSACGDAMRIKISVLSQCYGRQCAGATVQPSLDSCLKRYECTE